MTRSSRIVFVGIAIALFLTSYRAQLLASNYDPTAGQQHSESRDTFIKYSLRRINPADKDYGECVSEVRLALFNETIKNGYFWSNLLSLFVLTGLFASVVYQQRSRTNQEQVTAEFIAQFEHSLCRSEAQLTAALQKNRELASALADSRASDQKPPPSAADRALPQTVKPQPNSTKPNSQTLPAVKPERSKGDFRGAMPSGTKRTNQMGLFAPDVDLIMKINSLEQQLAYAQRDNTALRRKVADTDRRLDPQQERNQLKKA